MAKIAFILLCHQNPKAVIAQAERLTKTGDYVAIHYDARAAREDYAAIKSSLTSTPNVVFSKRIKCGWGEWSLVRASLNALTAAETAFPDATHFYLISGDCMPIKSNNYARAFLDEKPVDYIESVNFFTSGWIKTGIKEDRLFYRHYFNERKQKSWFYRTLNFQRRFGLKRDIPSDLDIMIGSQWWCLRRSTVEKILEFIKTRKDVMRFFSTTWIPDEIFFQTIVRHLIPRDQIESRTPTFLSFTDYGFPATFHNDHYKFLLSQNFLFARKISPHALSLKSRLGALWASQIDDFPSSGDGHRVFTFLTQRGRVGRRFAQRFWERNSSMGRKRSLYIIVCKKWHVAKRLAQQAETTLGIKTLDYVFDELGSKSPDLGGIEANLSKRHGHRRAFIRMIFDTENTDRLIFCADPGSYNLISEFYGDNARIGTLLIDCDFDDSYLEGHAQRISLATDETPKEALVHLLPTLRYDIQFEADQVRDAEHDAIYEIGETRPHIENITVLEQFFNCTRTEAEILANTPYLFED